MPSSGQAKKASAPVKHPQEGVWDVCTPAQSRGAKPDKDNLPS